MLRLLFWIVELFSMLMTAFIGSVLYVAGFVIALVYVAIRWLYHFAKEAAA